MQKPFKQLTISTESSISYVWQGFDYAHNKTLTRASFNCRFYLNRFPVYFNLFVLLSLVTPCFVVAVQSCMQWIPNENNKNNKKSIEMLDKCWILTQLWQKIHITWRLVLEILRCKLKIGTSMGKLLPRISKLSLPVHFSKFNLKI